MFLNQPFTDDLNDDYRRLGIRRDECRQVIIRKAASRVSTPLASVTDDDPRDQSVTSMLSAVATSTYRLLDPRRRSNAVQRALIGRVSELELLESNRESWTTGRVFGRVMASTQLAPPTPYHQSSANGRAARLATQGARSFSRLVHALPRISRSG